MKVCRKSPRTNTNTNVQLKKEDFLALYKQSDFETALSKLENTQSNDILFSYLRLIFLYQKYFYKMMTNDTQVYNTENQLYSTYFSLKFDMNTLSNYFRHNYLYSNFFKTDIYTNTLKQELTNNIYKLLKTSKYKESVKCYEAMLTHATIKNFKFNYKMNEGLLPYTQLGIADNMVERLNKPLDSNVGMPDVKMNTKNIFYGQKKYIVNKMIIRHFNKFITRIKKIKNLDFFSRYNKTGILPVGKYGIYTYRDISNEYIKFLFTHEELLNLYDVFIQEYLERMVKSILKYREYNDEIYTRFKVYVTNFAKEYLV